MDMRKVLAIQTFLVFGLLLLHDLGLHSYCDIPEAIMSAAGNLKRPNCFANIAKLLI